METSDRVRRKPKYYPDDADLIADVEALNDKYFSYDSDGTRVYDPMLGIGFSYNISSGGYKTIMLANEICLWDSMEDDRHIYDTDFEEDNFLLTVGEFVELHYVKLIFNLAVGVMNTHATEE